MANQVISSLRTNQNDSAIHFDPQPTPLRLIREHERLCKMLGIDHQMHIRTQRSTTTTSISQLELQQYNKAFLHITEPRPETKIPIDDYKADLIQKALEYLLVQMEQGKEPTPQQLSLYVGIKSRPLGTQLSKLGIKSMATRREGRGTRIYPLSMKPKIAEILKNNIL
ncbi:MAG: hypothetical protein MUO26_07255 [Methanotrichaceae archaeon]|nr:hypothetical protein [Methanotrichaceae archaeon]